MALFGRNTGNNDVPEDLQQYYNTSGSNNALKWVLRVVAGLAVLALLVGAGIWVAHKISNNSNKPQTATNQQSQDQKKTQQQQAAQAQADAQKAAQEAQQKAAQQAQQQAQQQQAQTQQPPQVASNNGAGANGSTTPTQTQATTNNSSSNLPNTGPGETAAVLFAGAAILGAGAHLVMTRKRQLR